MLKHHSLVVGCPYVNLSGIGLITKMRSLEVPYKYRHQITLTLEQMFFFFVLGPKIC